MSEPSAEAKQAAKKWGSKHGGQLSCGWQHVFARGYDAATAKLQRIADDSIVENVRQMNEIAKLRAENKELLARLNRYETIDNVVRRFSPPSEAKTTTTKGQQT